MKNIVGISAPAGRSRRTWMFGPHDALRRLAAGGLAASRGFEGRRTGELPARGACVYYRVEPRGMKPLITSDRPYDKRLVARARESRIGGRELALMLSSDLANT